MFYVKNYVTTVQRFVASDLFIHHAKVGTAPLPRKRNCLGTTSLLAMNASTEPVSSSHTQCDIVALFKY